MIGHIGNVLNMLLRTLLEKYRPKKTLTGGMLLVNYFGILLCVSVLYYFGFKRSRTVKHCLLYDRSG